MGHLTSEGKVKTIFIKRIGNGWYDFKDVPQGYIKVHGMPCDNDEKAIAYAIKLNPEYYYEVI